MYEILLNGILHFFAIFASQNQARKELARSVVERYLRHTLGVSRIEVYVGLFDQFLDLYADVKDPDVLKKNVRSLCENLQESLTRTEQYLVVIRVVELAHTIGADAASRGLLGGAARDFSLPDPVFAAIEKLVREPYDVERLSRDFLAVSLRDLGASGPRRLAKDHFRGEFVVLKIAEAALFLLVVLDGEITIDNNTVPAGVPQVLPFGSLIRDQYSNPVYFSEIERAFDDDAGNEGHLTFTGRDVNFRFPGSDNGLHDFSFQAASGSLIGVMGGSGVGKSTLLSILNGTLRPDSGTLTINGLDLYGERESIEGLMGVVPQDDLLFADLTVYQNLLYSARLCLARLTDGELRERVERTLLELNQLEIKDLKVGTPVDKIISGGQRKRLNIALELIREPAILFVDEPTSGLSSSDSENVMGLLKAQASKGKLVIVNIHQPSSNIFRMFDELWILDQGGYPVFVGNPLEAIRHFRSAVDLAGADQIGCAQCGNVTPDNLLSILETKRIDEAGLFTRERKYPPQFWHDLYRRKRSEPPAAAAAAVSATPPARTLYKPGRWGQLKIFLERNVVAKLSSRQYLAINLLEAPVLALIVAGLVRFSNYGEYSFADNKYLATFYFMSLIVSLFMGLSVSAEEIVRDRSILKRESFLNLSWFSYWLSKSLYLAALSAVQMAIYVLICSTLLEIPGMDLKMFGVLFSCSVFACLLGLNISSAFRTAVAIYILIPLLLIPQILLCGMVIKFDDLVTEGAGNNHVPALGDVMASRWGLEALIVEQYRSNLYQANFEEADRAISRAEYLREHLAPEIQAKLDFLFLKTDLPDKERKQERYAAVAGNAIGQLAEATGLLPPLTGPLFTPAHLTRERVEEIRAYLARVSDACAAKKAAALALKGEITRGLLERYGEKGLDDLRKKHENRTIVNLARNKEELDPLRLSGDRLVQLSDPVYQPPQSAFGRAVFLASEKRLGGYVIETYWFNLLVIWVMAGGLAVALHVKLLKRLLDR